MYDKSATSLFGAIAVSVVHVAATLHVLSMTKPRKKVVAKYDIPCLCECKLLKKERVPFHPRVPPSLITTSSTWIQDPLRY